MTPDDIQTMLKSSLGGFLGKDANKALWSVSKQINAYVNREIKERAAKEKVIKTVESTSSNKLLQELIDNPMSEDTESRTLRAIYQLQLSTGELSPQLLDKMDKIIGVGTGKDEAIELVDFSDAFPDYAEAIRICGKPQPVICECGGIKA